tara:strand:- start:173 stop:2656 length:2484 start_codon:yes stop_codon:yes gene_type:complete
VAEERIPMASLVDSGLVTEEEPDEASVEVNIDVPQDFEGGAEVIDDGQGGAIVQALMGQQATEVMAEPYDHNANLAEALDDATLGELSSELRASFEDDQESRSEWENTYTKGLDLLGIQYDDRTEPFEGASGVTHPLISESVTQFQAQSYKELLPSGGPVKTQLLGEKTPEREAQAGRIKEFMNYQITEVMEEFDPDTDQMLFYLPLSGSTFKKVYFDATKQRAVSKFIPAQDLVVPYSASDVQTASRVTHVLRMDENELRKLQLGGIYRDLDLSSGDEDTTSVEDKVSELEGVSKSYSEDTHTILECHADLDIEGFEDMGMDGQPTGLKLPYIVTLHKDSGEVLAIRRNYAEGDQLKKKQQYFVHYKFMPGLGFYGSGLIHMLGGLGRAATSILRQLIDAGTLANLPAGFKARGVRVRNDDEPLQPGEFRDIDAPGGNIRDAIIPLPYKEPSGTLATLLASLVDSGRRFVSIADAKMSEGNKQNAPVGTTVALLERGMKVMSAIHKRLHYAQKTEFRLLARIFAENLPPLYPYEVAGAEQQIKATDFDARVDVLPVSDPNIFSMAQRVTLAQTQLQLAQSNPQIHNLHTAYRRMYQALEVQNIEEILPPPPQPQPTDPAIENARALAGELLQVFPEQNHDAHILVHTTFMQTPLVATSPQVMGTFYSHLQEHIAHKARAMVEKEVNEAAQGLQEGVQQGTIDPVTGQTYMNELEQGSTDPASIEERVAQIEVQLMKEVMAAVAPPQQVQEDPLVKIRMQELAIKQQQAKNDADVEQAKLQLEQMKMQQRAATDSARLELQEEIADDRNQVNRERIDVQRQSTQQRG